MLTLTTKVRVDGLTGREVTDFLLHADDEDCRRWWKGTHLQFHTLRRMDGDVGNLIYFEEFVGKRRVRSEAVVLDVVPGRRLVLQMKWGIRLPVRLTFELVDDAGGVTITQRIQAGFAGAGRILDPLLRLYFSREHIRSLDEHARTELPMLRDLLHEGRGGGAA